MIDVDAALKDLASSRPIFHSEADFQFSLAWSIQHRHPEASLRLEYRPFSAEKLYLDIWIRDDDSHVAIELKYLTRGLVVPPGVTGDESFTLLSQGAHDIRRYDVVKDLWRLEHVVRERPATRGYLICLTNDRSYWAPSLGGASADAAFRIHQGRHLSGSLSWGASAGPGTMKGRPSPIDLRGGYVARWSDYSKGSLPGQEFRYLMIRVPQIASRSGSPP